MAEAGGKRCLYEVLGVARDCSADEIRAAYKRRALQLHPDKLASSGLSPAAATAAFQELAHAYEVLSDPRERSWYDSHRSQLLFAPADPTSPSPDLDLSPFFSPAAFSGFSDSGRGFYKVYADLFSKLYGRELHYCNQMGLTSDSVPPAPSMGNLDSPYSQVTAFYNYWLGFSTTMDFAWVDAFDSAGGPNRRSRRVMEEENKKVRRKARREYNDTVRGLAAYVKKRDKRVIDMQVKKKEEERRRRVEELEKRKEEERRKAEQAKAYEEPEWARIDSEEEETVLGGRYDEGQEKKRGKELYCVVCNKKFKSDKQWKNHEQSKKHRDKVAELRDLFRKEEAAGEEEEDEDGEEEIRVSFDYVPQPEDEEVSDVVDELSEEFEDVVGVEENGSAKGAEEKLDVEDKDDDDDEASIREAMVSGLKSKKSDYVPPRNSSSKKDAHPNDSKQTTAMEYDTRRRSHRNRGKGRGFSAETDDGETVRGETSEVGQDEAELQRREYNVEDTKENSSTTFKGVAARSKGDHVAEKNHKSKKQPVEVKGGKKATNFETKNSSKGRKQKATSKAPNNACETCGESFDSRNKLFAHLGDTGHTALKSR